MPKGTVELTDNFAGWHAELERDVTRAMGHGLSRVVATVRSVPSKQGYNVQPILGKTGVSAVKRGHGGRGGLLATVVIRDFRGLWFDLGTYQNRRRKVKKSTLRRRRAGAAETTRVGGQGELFGGENPGVKPQRWLEIGLKRAWPAFLEEIGKALPK